MKRPLISLGFTVAGVILGALTGENIFAMAYAMWSLFYGSALLWCLARWLRLRVPKTLDWLFGGDSETVQFRETTDIFGDTVYRLEEAPGSAGRLVKIALLLILPQWLDLGRRHTYARIGSISILQRRRALGWK